MSVKRLTVPQIEALAHAATHKARFRTGDRANGATVAQATAKALKALNLFVFEVTSGWRPMAIGSWHQYKATAAGRELMAIGRMFAPLHF